MRMFWRKQKIHTYSFSARGFVCSNSAMADMEAARSASFF